jgi:hypothetical protein
MRNVLKLCLLLILLSGGHSYALDVSKLSCSVQEKDGTVNYLARYYPGLSGMKVAYYFSSPEGEEVEVILPTCHRFYIYKEVCETTRTDQPIRKFTHYLNGTWTVTLVGDESDHEYSCERVVK